MAIKSCVFNVHAREAEENNRMSLGPKNSEVTTDTHEKCQWMNLRIAAGMVTGTHSMDDEHGWSEMVWAHWTAGLWKPSQLTSPNSLLGNISHTEEKPMEIKLKYDKSRTIEIKENIFK